MIREAIAALTLERRDLTEDEAYQVMGEIMRAGESDDPDVATPAQFGSFVTALALKGETVDEIVGMARSMREHALPVEIQARPLLDTCGTGGSQRKVFNASTSAAFVAAAAGAQVAKHGNRAATSRSGSADLLEALGAQIALTPEQVAGCVEQTGVGFMFAQAFHPAMKFAGPLRPQIGIRTVFNILGPLTNPAGANCQLLGVANAETGGRLAGALARLGVRHALVVSGRDGLDDLTVDRRVRCLRGQGRSDHEVHGLARGARRRPLPPGRDPGRQPGGERPDPEGGAGRRGSSGGARPRRPQRRRRPLRDRPGGHHRPGRGTGPPGDRLR